MNKLPYDKRAQIIYLLVEGYSMRATARIADVAFNSVVKLFFDTAKVCDEYQGRALRNLSCKKLQLDEVWSFVGCKQKNALEGAEGIGDVWTWVAIDADTKLVPSWRIGRRDSETAKEFVADLAGRLANRAQITSDGRRPYLEPVEGAFGSEVDCVPLIKIYGNEIRYSPAECVGAKKMKVTGNSNPVFVSMSFVEKHNLKMRMSIRHFSCLTNAFGKKLENHALSVALHYMHYNLA